MKIRRGWRLVFAIIAIGWTSSAFAQSESQPPPPMPPPPPPVPQPPPLKAKQQNQGRSRHWRDSLADWMIWNEGDDWAVGHVIKDPLTTGFGNSDFLEPQRGLKPMRSAGNRAANTQDKGHSD